MDLLSNSGELITPPQCGGIVEFRVEGHQFERLNGTCNIVLIEKTSDLRAYFNDFVTKRVMRWLDAEGFGLPQNLTMGLVLSNILKALPASACLGPGADLGYLHEGFVLGCPLFRSCRYDGSGCGFWSGGFT